MGIAPIIVDVGGEVMLPSAGPHTVPPWWPAQRGISSRCLAERSCALTDKELSNRYAKEEKPDPEQLST